MPPSHCQCGQLIFFENAQCLRCQSPVGICPACWNLTSLRTKASVTEGVFICERNGCGTELRLCQNNQLHGFCNCLVDASELTESFCVFCRLNEMIPDLSIPGNLEKWSKLETAKRRTLFGAHHAGFPFGPNQGALHPILKFSFKSDAVEPVTTGHFQGSITINLSEADEVERERQRVNLGEPQRTLIGHFRHELGHYYWSLLVENTCVLNFRNIFGDERNPDYATAQQIYYSNGPAYNWSLNYISAYASMHPWEDFAETFNAYLDMRAVLATSSFFGLSRVKRMSVKRMVAEYARIGVIANEMCRDMGLIDLVPTIVNSPVIQKMEFIHDLTKS